MLILLSKKVGYINYVLQKAPISKKLKYVETSSAYNTRTVTVPMLYSGFYQTKNRSTQKYKMMYKNFAGVTS